MKQYLDLVSKILVEGDFKPAARQNMPGTYSLFGEQLKFDLRETFPMITTKKVSFKNIVTELLWFLKGDTNIKYLVDNGCNIWNEDAYNYYKKILKNNDIRGEGYSFEEFVSALKEQGTVEIVGIDGSAYKLGDCGKQYGWLWRNWTYAYDHYEPGFEDEPVFTESSIDQLIDLIEGIKTNPMSRRHLLTAWNPATLNDMALHPCHAFVQFNIVPMSFEDRIAYCNKHHDIILGGFPEETYQLDKIFRVPKYYIDCQMYQRSADTILGVPYNISSYALLTKIIAKICKMVPRNFIHTFGDVHIYENHVEAAKEQLLREPKEQPILEFDGKTQWILDAITVLPTVFKKLDISGFSLKNYNPHPKLVNETKLSTGL